MRISIFVIIIFPFIFGCSNEGKIDNEISLQIKKHNSYNSSDSKYDFGIIRDFIIDNNNDIYLLDVSDYSIKKIFNQDGRIDAFPLGKGKGPCELLNPKSISIDPYNNLYIADMNLQKIVVIDSLKNCLPSLQLKSLPSRILSVGLNKVLVYNFPFRGGDSLIQYYNFQNEYENDNPNVVYLMEKIWNNKAIDYTGSTGRIIKDYNGNIYCSYYFPYEIRKYSSKFKLLKKFTRKEKYFEEPVFKNSIVKSTSGIKDIFILNEKYLCAQIFYEKNEKTVTQIDVFNTETEEYLGYINLEKFNMKNIKFIRTNNKEYLYLCTDTPFPQIVKYSVILD